MKLQLKRKKIKRVIDHKEWGPWFAWHPVETIDTKLVWLQTVERRCFRKESELMCSEAGCILKYRLPPQKK